LNATGFLAVATSESRLAPRLSNCGKVAENAARLSNAAVRARHQNSASQQKFAIIYINQVFISDAEKFGSRQIFRLQSVNGGVDRGSMHRGG
jgi:hypothetical protein